MPRYFFHVRDGKVIPDHKGAELPDARAARLNAIAIAGRLLADEPECIALGEDWMMEVSDDTGLILFRLDFTVMETAATMDHGPRARPDAVGHGSRQDEPS